MYRVQEIKIGTMAILCFSRFRCELALLDWHWESENTSGGAEITMDATAITCRYHLKFLYSSRTKIVVMKEIL
jgi:hypothetical protein